jgi:uncharacterized membrane protein
MDVEVITRAIDQSMVGCNGIKPLSLMGFTSLWMFLVGGSCGVIIGYLNDYPEFYNEKILKQVLAGGTIITLMELFSGIVLNIILKLNIWNYTGKYQFMGQIELKNCILWYLVVTPLIIWFDDMLTYYIYKEGEPYSLLKIYYELITLR